MTREYTPTTAAVKDRYSMQEPVQELLKAEFDRWLAAHDQEKQAEAWEDGFEDGVDFNDHTPSGISIDPPLNPYRNNS